MTRRFSIKSQISRAIGIAALAGAIVTVSCGPELTAPASTDVSGTWFAAGPAAGLTNVTMTLIQNSDGTISGTYTATGTPNLQFCPATGPCAISGTISGVNSVFQVFFELRDAGQFTGQLIDGSTLKGAMNRIDSTEPIQFAKS
jgi:hypothetical protein